MNSLSFMKMVLIRVRVSHLFSVCLLSFMAVVLPKQLVAAKLTHTEVFFITN